MNTRKLRALADVRRFNYERCNRYQSVAEHSFFVAILAMQAADVLKWDWSAYGCQDVITHALMHDAAEAVTGDILHLTKRALPKHVVESLETMAEEELEIDDMPHSKECREIVEFCDVLELALYLQEEQASGNTTLITIYKETIGRLARNPLWSKLEKWAMDVLGMDSTDAGWVLEMSTMHETPFFKH